MADAPCAAEVVVVNEKGLHARAAARLVRLAEGFAATVNVANSDMSVLATSILGLMMLAARKGQRLHIEASGAEAAEALRAIVDLVERGFGEV